MRNFVDYFVAYWRRGSRVAFGWTLLILAILITINYSVGIERRIRNISAWYLEYACFAAFYGGMVTIAWTLQRTPVIRQLRPVLAVAVLLFSAKMVHWDLSRWLPGTAGSAENRYWVIVSQLPAKLLFLIAVIWLIWRAGRIGPAADGSHGESDTRERSNFRSAVGLTTKGFHARPYFELLLLLIPLVALACTQPDFLRVYPRVRTIDFMNGCPGPMWLRRAGYELSYGLDFLSIELFFRGLLVVGLVRYAGEKAILPMATMYCTIHFGKPLGECITSFGGGLALGVLAYRTRSVLGGLIVHLGLAWLMEGMSFLFIFIHSPA